ncbi:hypothetical protein NQ176_g484 [Zarea fungicola]|uniref:Uncharacterized protein n=1 Tax=Zarea fungicola TaxID=93591 RepID=A0ACC1NWN6_9HYPO|nr:hypothetical protein NQ176_g484 [Lecanicillium fungicola]
MLVNLKSAFLFGLVALSQAEPIRRFERDTVGSGDLEIRAKGKSVTDFLCPDKKLLTKNDVGNALVKGRDLENQKKKVGGKYPGFFGNEGNGGSIFGASAELREFPIIPNSVYNGGNPDKYRVVFKAGGKKDFVGVMVHGAANSFQRCDPAPAAPPTTTTTTTKAPAAATPPPAAPKHTTTKKF